MTHQTHQTHQTPDLAGFMTALAELNQRYDGGEMPIGQMAARRATFTFDLMCLAQAHGFVDHVEAFNAMTAERR